LGFGPLNFDYKKLPAGVNHPKYVYMGVVAGIGNYGNNMGIPTVNGAVCFDESYVGNVVVYCGCVGLLPLGKFRKNAELTEKSEAVSRPAVQIANPIEEEKLKRAIVEIRDLELASAITDLGGGGLSSAVGETAKKFGCGAEVELDKVPLKYGEMAPWEIYVSESQERMLLTVPRGNLEKVLKIFEREDVEATPIGQLTADNVLILRYERVKVAELDISFLFKPPRTVRIAKYESPEFEEPDFPEPSNLAEVLKLLLSSPNIASKESVVRIYDHEVKGNTVIKPLQGIYAGPNDAAVLKPLSDSWKGIVLSCGINPSYGKIDPYWMAASAIDEAIRNNVAVGGRRIALLDNFTWGNPEKPERLGSLVRACEACYDVATALGTPFISGKDSLYNESPLGPVTPTLLISALGVIPDIRLAVSMETKTSGDIIYVVGETFKELGGSEYYRLRGILGKTVPKVQVVQAKRIFKAVTAAIDAGLVKACHDLSEGGLAVAAAEMCFAGGYGMKLDLRKVPQEASLDRDDFILFSESNSRFLVELSEQGNAEFENLMKGKPFAALGKTTRDRRLRFIGLKGKVVLEASVDELGSMWRKALSSEVQP
jgi:phosphoribosylformylglycinamidine synthase